MMTEKVLGVGRSPLGRATLVTDAAPQVAHLSSQETDAPLIALARKGDAAGYDALITRYRERALRLAAGILDGRDEAEDAVQESFLRAFAQLDEFRGEAQFFTWFHRIIVRVCLNRMRTPWWRRERKTKVVLEDEGWSQPGQFVSSSQASHEPDSNLKMQVENLLAGLSPPLRAALILREVEGMEYAEIADTLKIPVGTVRSRLSVAREQFRDLWETAEEESRHV